MQWAGSNRSAGEARTGGRCLQSRALPNGVDEGGESGGAAAEYRAVEGDVGQRVVDVAAGGGGEQLFDAVAGFVKVCD